MTSYLDKWQPVADDVLCVLIHQPARWVDMYNAGFTSQDMPPGKWRDVYMAVFQLASSSDGKRALQDTDIAIKAGSAVSVEWVAERIGLYDDYRAGAFASQVDTLLTFGAAHRQYEIMRSGAVRMAAALNNGLHVDGVAHDVIDALQSEARGDADKPTEGDKILGEVLEDHGQPKTIKTGINLLDEWTGGMLDTEFVAWVAPYKSRKTSVMANVVMHRLKAGDQLSIFSFDESRKRFVNRLRAMFATEYLFNNGEWSNPLNAISGKMLWQAGQKWREWDKPLRAAVEYANDSLLVYGKQFRLYDRAVFPGTMASLTALCRVDRQKYGLDMVFVDHLQSVSGYKTLFETVEYGSAALHALRGELECRVWLLSQQNEAAIAGNDEGSWSPNTKGGGGLASSADTIIVSKYKQGTNTDPKMLRIELRQARDEESQVYGYVEIHPASGWITPRKIDTVSIDPETWGVKKS